jgi:hypothetical protein
MPKKSEKKRDKKKSQKRLKKRVMRGCSKTLRGGNFDTPTFQVGISKFYPMNSMATDVQRNMTMDRGITADTKGLVGGSRKRRYSRKYLDPLQKRLRGGALRGGALRGGALGSLSPFEYKPSVVSSNPTVQSLGIKYDDFNPYLV